jgi:hypothetical protein
MSRFADGVGAFDDAQVIRSQDLYNSICFNEIARGTSLSVPLQPSRDVYHRLIDRFVIYFT